MAAALSILSWWKRPLNRAWTRLGVLLGQIATPLVLALLFLLAFVPLGLILRIREFRPFRLELEPEKELLDRARSTGSIA